MLFCHVFLFARLIRPTPAIAAQDLPSRVRAQTGAWQCRSGTEVQAARTFNSQDALSPLTVLHLEAAGDSSAGRKIRMEQKDGNKRIKKTPRPPFVPFVLVCASCVEDLKSPFLSTDSLFYQPFQPPSPLPPPFFYLPRICPARDAAALPLPLPLPLPPLPLKSCPSLVA